MTVETINTLAIEVQEEKQITERYEIPICRICLQEEIDMNSLISPCQCCGSSKYVHRECLDEWRRTSRNPMALTQCEICATTYHVRQMSYHHFHEWCLQIKFNVWAVFIYHQLVSILLTLLYLSTQPMRLSQNQYNDGARHTSTNHIIYSAYTVYICNIITPLVPILLYAGYVFARYARNKKEVCSSLCANGLPSCLYIVLCAACTYLVLPDFLLITIVLLTWIIDAFIMLLFEKIEKVNRRYPQEIILNIDIP